MTAARPATAVAPAAFVHPLLRVATPAAWIAAACSAPDLLLIDHANCEKKAASTALALMFAYAEDLDLADKMSRLAREELRHYEQVAKLLRSLKIVPRRLGPGRYAERMRRLVATAEPRRAVDLMICGAFIEARSCERFAALAPVIGGEVGELFGNLHAAEARHHRVYLELARRAAARAAAAGTTPGTTADLKPLSIDLAARIDEFAVHEAALITGHDEVFRFHSGVPGPAL